ncbi:MAG: glycosyltransferase family 4 protein [Solirubrobacteraceae bacterium]
MTIQATADGRPRVLMLGKGWFPSDIGGLDRYYRELLEQLPQAQGLVVGPAPDAPPRVTAVSTTDAPLPRRLVALTRAASRGAKHADVVDAHFALYAFWPVVVGSLRRKPLIVHFQGPWADENAAAGDLSRWKRGARWRLERAVYRRADTVVTLTSAFRRVAVERYGVSPWRVRVERPGVDVERFGLGDRAAARAALGLNDEAFVAVCVRRLVGRMGLDVLLDAWEHGSTGRTLLIAGDGPLRETLAARIAGSPTLRASVRMLGRISGGELVDLYRAADVNVVPTLAFEGFGLVVLEAAACGTPSLVTDAGGLPEAIRGAPGAQAVPAGDAQALRDALRVAASSASSRLALRTWAEEAAWPVVAERH